MKNLDISICINYKDDVEILCRDLNPKGKYGLTQKSIRFETEPEDSYVCFEGYVSEKDLSDILDLCKMSPYGDGYEVLLWIDGNSVELW